MILQCFPKVYKDPWFGPLQLDVDGNRWLPSEEAYVDVSVWLSEGDYVYTITNSLDFYGDPVMWLQGDVIKVGRDTGTFECEIKEEDWSYHVRQFQKDFYQFCCSLPAKKEVLHEWMEQCN